MNKILPRIVALTISASVSLNPCLNNEAFLDSSQFFQTQKLESYFRWEALASGGLSYEHPGHSLLDELPSLAKMLRWYGESHDPNALSFALLKEINGADESLQEIRRKQIPYARGLLEKFSSDLMQELPGQQQLWSALAQLVREQAPASLLPGFEASPRLILKEITEFKLWEKIVSNSALLDLLERESIAYDRRTDPREKWVTQHLPELVNVPIAYFTAEEAWDSLGTYGGGLGVLSGDHTRGANDLGLVHLSVSLLYDQGYFRQLITREGRQESEDRARIDTSRLAIQAAHAPGAHDDLILDLPFPSRDSPGKSKSIKAKVWIAHYGNSIKLLLDTNISENIPEDRLITDRLYRGNGGTHIRMEQYYLIGVGGQRALEAMGWTPQVYHMNDCHPVFSALERLSETFRDLYATHRRDPPDRLFEAAYQLVRARTVFTTHTPIEAGNETVPLDVIRPFLTTMLNDAFASLRLTESERNAAVEYAVNRIFSMGVLDENLDKLNLAALNIRMASHVNGVSELHGQVSRKLWKRIYPGLKQEEVPIGDVTNAVHGEYFQAPELAALLEEGPVQKALAPYIEHPENLMSKLRSMSPEEALRWVDEELLPVDGRKLWQIHLERKKRLLIEALRRLDAQIADGRASLQDRTALASFDPEAVTIGFARRFIPYKRGRLVFTDLDRLIRIAQRNNQPIQLYIAGKAHPDDEPSKRIIYDVNQKIAELRAKGVMVKAVFVENYDVRLARFLESGVDVWLNNPVRPMEASGTSGMKVAWNAGLNLSTSDGWCEGGIIHGINGWIFGVIDGQNDVLDAAALYNRLDRIAALYAIRDSQGIPEEWVRMMKASLVVGICQFGMQRMLSGYAKNLYLPTFQESQRLTVEDALTAADERLEKRKLLSEGISAAEASAHVLPYPHFISNRSQFYIETEIDLGSIKPKDIGVDVHMIRRPSNQDDPEEHSWFGSGEQWTSLGRGRYRYTVSINPLRRGDYSLELRITSRDQTLWASPSERIQNATRYIRSLPPIHADDEDLLKFRVRADQPAEGRLFYIHLPMDEASGEELTEAVYLVSHATNWVSSDGLWKTYKLERVYDGWWAIVLPISVTGQEGRFDFKFYAELKDGRCEWMNGTYQHGPANAFIDWESGHAFASVANAQQRLAEIMTHRPPSVAELPHAISAEPAKGIVSQLETQVRHLLAAGEEVAEELLHRDTNKGLQTQALEQAA